jgi:hypothetical protein
MADHAIGNDFPRTVCFIDLTGMTGCASDQFTYPVATAKTAAFEYYHP